MSSPKQATDARARQIYETSRDVCLKLEADIVVTVMYCSDTNTNPFIAAFSPMGADPEVIEVLLEKALEACRLRSWSIARRPS